nr:hypothetical protein BdHM001_30640 [Bdellovibrio sp. HM001]
MLKYVSSALFICLFSLSSAHATDKIKMYFNNEELSKVIEIYSKATGQKFVLDPGVRGKISIFNQEPVELTEAFNQLSLALSTNGFAISKQADVMVVKSARSIQRDLIDVTTEVPSVTPQRMVAWVVKLKNISVEDVMREVRVLPSRDGEMNSVSATNQIIFTDWSSNIVRIAEILKTLDKPVDSATKKLIDTARKDRHAARRHSVREAHGPAEPPPASPKGQ